MHILTHRFQILVEESDAGRLGRRRVAVWFVVDVFLAVARPLWRRTQEGPRHRSVGFSHSFQRGPCRQPVASGAESKLGLVWRVSPSRFLSSPPLSPFPSPHLFSFFPPLAPSYPFLPFFPLPTLAPPLPCAPPFPFKVWPLKSS